MQVEDFGSVCLLVPTTDEELTWLKGNCQTEPWQWLGGALAVEPRLADAIMEGFESGRNAYEEEQGE